MKVKSIVATLLIASMFLLCSCEPRRYSFDYDYLMENVVAVELVFYDSNFADILDLDKEVPIFDQSKTRLIKALAPAEFQPFFEDLCKTILWEWRGCMNSPMHECLVMRLSNGNFIAACGGPRGNEPYSSFIFEFDKDSNYVRFIGTFHMPIKEFRFAIQKHFYGITKGDPTPMPSLK